MELNDFGCFLNGQLVARLPLKDGGLLSPVTLKNNKKKRALLLLHGFSSSPAVFRFLIPLLPPYDFIYAPCLPGHGDSIADFSRLKAEDLFLFIDTIGANLVEDYQQVDVLGLSLGGLLAHYLSTCFPIHHRFLLAPAFDLHINIERMLSISTVLSRIGFSRLRSRAGNLCTSTSCEISFLQLPISTVLEVLTLIYSYGFKASNCPTDLFLGMHDKVVASTQVAQRFASDAHVYTHWLEHSAHVLPLDNDINTIASVIQQRW